MKSRFFIRQITEPEELRKLFALRYRVFREDQKIREYTPENIFELDIDAYDMRALHFGLFRHQGGSSVLVGGMRLVLAEGRVCNAHINALCDGCPELQRAIWKPTRKLPFLEFAQLGSRAQRWMHDINPSSLAEPGRFCIEPSSRQSGLGLFMIRSMAAIAHFYLGLSTGIISASWVLATMYRKLGFEFITGTHNAPTDEIDYALLSIHPHDLSPAHQTVLRQKAEAYRQTGQIVHEANTIHFIPEKLQKTA